MKCQYCHENNAVNTFWVIYPGGRQEVHLCEECSRVAQHYYEVAKQGGAGAFASIGMAEKRKADSIQFPKQATRGIRHRRYVNVLKARLEQAVQEERYEEAAQLRDEIASEEKDVYAV